MYINVAICDDEQFFIEMLQKNIKQLNIKNISFNIDTFTSGNDLINKVRNGKIYNIIFMDINLKEKFLGTDVGMIIKLLNPDTLFVYMSSYDIYYKDLVSAEPFAFLEKPIIINKLTSVVNSALTRIHYLNYSYLYTYKANGKINIINLKEVMYFESQHRIVLIHMKNETTISFYNKLDSVENEVDKIYPFFIRVSKSFLVNINFVKSLYKTEVCLLDDTLIKITHSYEKNVLSKFDNFIQ